MVPGYYCDEESGFYYLNTRYYDPVVKWFLNRDLLENETNLYQYCYNNPVVNSDENGMTAYSCSDSNLTFINSVSGYTRRDILPKAKSNYRSEYYNGSQYAHFNCYLWSLGIIVTDKNNLDKNESNWSFKAGWEGPVFQLKSGLKPNQITWCGYGCTDGKIWKANNGIYDSVIYYISYK